MADETQFGIKETKEVLDAAIALGNAVDQSLEDNGKVDWTEYHLFLPVITKLPKAISDISDVPSELKNLDEAEQAEIKAFIAEKLDLADDVTEAKIEAIFESALKTFIAVLELTTAIRS